jgi:glycosyltransferase involved in cell wall biosynthesis
MKILFISHQASKTGAPIALLSFVKWLSKSQNHKLRFFIVKGGDLNGDFKKYGKTFVLEKKWRGKFEMIMLGFDDLFPHIRQHINGLKVSLYTLFYTPDLIYVNSVASLKTLPFIRNKKKIRVLCHVHELEFVIRQLISETEFIKISKYIERYIVPSEIVGKNLTDNYSIQADCIEVIPEHINIADPSEPKKKITDELKIDDKSFIVMGSGITLWRKAPEIFIMIAQEVVRHTDRKFKFIWLGELYPPYYKCLLHDIKQMNLSEVVAFIDQVDNVYNYLQVADVFLLVSREDPYPLVCLEAASQGVPIICFDKSNGMQEFVNEDAGFVVPYIDIKVVAEKIIELMNNPELKEKLGRTGKKRVHEESDINITGPKIIKLIEKTEIKSF